MHTVKGKLSFVICFISTVLLSIHILAQPSGQPKSYSPPSPTAANLGLYAVTPVDFYTGIPSISVPIFNIGVKDASLNISLSYHAGGVRQSDEASWVGLGWSLNAGGVITRSKRDGDDLSNSGFYKNPSPPCSGAYDQEPDIFFFNFCGRTGKFIIEDNTGNIAHMRFISREMLNIQLTALGVWIITDESGTEYTFGMKENTQEVVTAPDNSTSTENYTSAWYLTNIKNRFGESIDLQYQNTGAKSYKASNSYSRSAFAGASRPETLTTSYMIGIYNGAEWFSRNSTTVTRTTKSETIVDEVLLKRIVYPLGSIDFETEMRYDLRTHSSGMMYGNRLREIVIRKGKSNSDEVFKKFTLAYGSFNSLSGQAESVSSRLKLTTVTEVSGEFSLNPYQFIYNTNVLPDKTTSNRLGGFLDNVTDGLIEKIIYPTGGSIQFQFEPHFANAGARIKRVVQKESDNNYNVRNYEYVGGKKLGESMSFVGGTESINYSAVPVGGGSAVNGSLLFNITISSDNCMLGESSSEYLIGYDQVVELFGDDGTFGKNVYSFINEANATPAYMVPAVVSNKNGYLTSKEEYKNEAGLFVITNKQVRDVDLVNQSTVQARRPMMGSCAPYPVNCDWIRLNWEKNYTYNKNGANPIVVSKNYYYDNPIHTMPTRIEEVDSKNNTWVRTRKYVFEANAENPTGSIFSTMVLRNIITPVVEETVSKGTTFISKAKSAFFNWYANHTVIAPTIDEVQKAGFPMEAKVRYHMYDIKGNPTEISEDDDVRSVYMWGYEYTKPIVEVKNATFYDVKYASFESVGYQGDWSYNVGFVANDNSSPMGPKCYSLNNTYPLNVGVPPNKSYILSYWVKANSNVVLSNIGVNAQNGRTINGWTYVQREIPEGGLINITGSGLIDDVRYYPKGSQMNSYAYDPLVGMKSHCDMNGIVTFYEYDEFGRLRLIRDVDGNVIKTYEYKYKQ